MNRVRGSGRTVVADSAWQGCGVATVLNRSSVNRWLRQRHALDHAAQVGGPCRRGVFGQQCQQAVEPDARHQARRNAAQALLPEPGGTRSRRAVSCSRRVRPSSSNQRAAELTIHWSRRRRTCSRVRCSARDSIRPPCTPPATSTSVGGRPPTDRAVPRARAGRSSPPLCGWPAIRRRAVRRARPAST